MFNLFSSCVCYRLGQTECIFYCNGCLVEWLPQEKAFEKQGYWFPDCVYVRYIKKPSFYHECLKYHKE